MLSIIIPAHNEEKCIINTIKNIRKAVDGFDYEIIVVCDNCVDNTYQLCVYEGVDIVLEVNNGKIAKTRNDGYKASNGDLLLFIDSDTIINKQSVNEAIKWLEDDIYSLVGTYSKGIEEYTFSSSMYELITNSYSFITSNVGGYFMLCRRSQFEPFPEDVKHEDAEFCKNMRKYGKVKIINTGVKTSYRRVIDNGLLKTVYYYSTAEVVLPVLKILFKLFIVITLLFYLYKCWS